MFFFHGKQIADRAKQIKTHATVNEDATNRLIKQLREENEKLKQMMDQEISNIPANVQANDQGRMQTFYQRKLNFNIFFLIIRCSRAA